MSEPNVIALSRFRADVGRALQRRATQLLESPNLAAEVQSLAPLDLACIIHSSQNCLGRGASQAQHQSI